MEDKNYIFDEILKGGEGVIKKENELFKNLLEFEKIESGESHLQKNNIIEFQNSDDIYTENTKIPMILAAESNIKNEVNKSDFLISKDGDFVIKLSKKLDEEIHLTLLSDKDINIEEAILYSRELNKYFVPNLSGDYVIGQYSNFDLTKLNFKAILPFEKILITLKDKSYSSLSVSNYSSPEITGINDTFVLLKPNAKKHFSNSTIINEKSKDFLEIRGGIIEIPIILITEKAYIYLY